MYLSEMAQNMITELRKENEFNLSIRKSNIADAMSGLVILLDYYDNKELITVALNELVNYNELLMELYKDEEK